MADDAPPSGQLPSEAQQPPAAAAQSQAPPNTQHQDLPRPLLRLSGLSTPHLPPPSAPASVLRPFLTALLNEAVPLITSAAIASSSSSSSSASSSPSSTEQVKAWKSKGIKRLSASDAPVTLTERVIHNTTTTTNSTSSDIWACRHSIHTDAARKGTASWEEFVHWVRDEHAASEEAFTPAVLGHRVVAQWEGEGVKGVGDIQVGGAGEEESTWHGFRILLVEMKHKLPPPLQPRVFPVLQVIASSSGGGGAVQEGEGEGEGREQDEAFLVISIPIADWPPQANASKSADWATTASSSGCFAADKGVVVGRYVSVEKVVRRVKNQGAEEQGGKTIEWTMATASDARGVLPLWVQTKAVPGQIAKDVGMFLGWVDGTRQEG